MVCVLVVRVSVVVWSGVVGYWRRGECAVVYADVDKQNGPA
jgi:hypothetical protein